MLENPFDQAAATWDEKPSRVELAMKVAEAVFGMAQPRSDSVVLDFGCGTGILALALARRVAKVVAADTSQGMLEQVRAKTASEGISNVETALIDDDGELPPGPFDLVVVSMALHHVEDLDSVFEGFASVLAPDGCIFIADLVEEDGSFHSDMDVPHKGFAPEDLADRLAELGFEESQHRIIHKIDKNGERFPVFALRISGVSSAL